MADTNEWKTCDLKNGAAMFGLFNKFDAIKYVQKITGYRCSHLSSAEFSEMKNSGLQEAFNIDPMQNPQNIPASPITMLGEFKYLFIYYEEAENKLAMDNIAKAIASFMKTYKHQIPEYSELIINLPTKYIY